MGNKYRKYLYLPERYELMAGDTFELFYSGVILSQNPCRYNINVRCPKGNAYRKKFVYTPTEDDIGEHRLTIELSDDYGRVLDFGEVTLHVNPGAKSPSDDLYVLCMGDSLSAYANWISECYRRLTASEDEAADTSSRPLPHGLGLEKLHFIGVKQGKYGAWFEGYGGWRFDQYNTAHTKSDYYRYIYTDSHTKTAADLQSSYSNGSSSWKLVEIEEKRIKLLRTVWRDPLAESGVLHHISGGADTSDINYTSVGIPANNPFWDEETDRVDFKKYVKKLGVPRIDICFILLGWNSVSEDENIYKAQVRKFLDTLRHDMPDCRVILMGLQMPASQDGIGRDYGASNSFMELAANTKKINKCYTDICREYEGVSFTDIAGQFDIDNGYPPFERKISERFEVIETVPSNAVHPGMDGYMQIGDAAFRELNAILVNEYNKD